MRLGAVLSTWWAAGRCSFGFERDADCPAYTVFRKDTDGTVRHFYSGECGMEVADPGQDPHSAPDMNSLWVLLDTKPEGRGTDWYPKLDD